MYCSTTPLLVLCGADGTDGAFRSLVPDIKFVHIAGAGHMLHIEKPALIAPVIEQFLEAH